MPESTNDPGGTASNGSAEGTGGDETTPPYPGWSTQQPPRPQSEQPAGWQQQGASAWEQPGASSWQQPGPHPQGGQQTQPGQPGEPDRPGAPPSDASGWQAAGAWTWRPPDVKPGVIPLRPLGVGEILDGAVTTIRRNLGAMLGLAVIVAVITQVVDLAVVWAVLGDVVTGQSFESVMTTDELLDLAAETFVAAGISLFVTWIAMVFLTGVLTVVVGRAVLGQHISVGEAWNAAKGRLPRLFGLTILYTLIWAGAMIAVIVVGAVVAIASEGAAAAILVVGLLASIPLGIWLYVKFALATPSLMLETTDAGRTQDNGGPRPVTIRESLRRSAELVRTSWWRVFGIMLLINIIVWIVSQVVSVPFSIPSLLGSDGLATDMSLGELAVSALGGILATAITAPFAAAATALLYIDRRIRREGLDIELARAAGTELPGRTPPPGQ